MIEKWWKMNKKTVLITGSSRGIGKAMAELFAENDYNVMINYYKSEEQARALFAKLQSKGYSVDLCRADISRSDDVKALVEKTIVSFGAIDVLINNAGIATTELFTDLEPEVWQQTIGVNLTGVYLTSRAALTHMLAAKSGKIINISSIWGMVGASCEVAYSASKAGVIGLTKALAKELAPSGITVNCIAPGAVDTDMLSGLTKDEINAFVSEQPIQRLGTPEEIAKLALYLASTDSDFLTGQVISPNGGVVI